MLLKKIKTQFNEFETQLNTWEPKKWTAEDFKIDQTPRSFRFASTVAVLLLLGIGAVLFIGIKLSGG